MTRTGLYGVSPAFRRGWLCFILALTVLPYLWGYWLTPPGHTYAWIIPPYPEDLLAYRAWSLQAYNGHLLFSIKYTALAHAPFLFHPFFLLCGWLSRLCQIDIGIVHLGMKSVGVILFFLTFFRFLEHFKLSRLAATAASVLVGLSSGFGYFMLRLSGGRAFEQGSPVDLRLIDANTFWSLLWNPLFPYSLTLILLSIRLMDEGTSENDPRRVWLSGLSLGLLALIHPYQPMLLYPLLAVIGLGRRGNGAGADLGRVALASAPFMAYLIALAFLHPLLKRHSSTGWMPSPPLADVIAGFGLPLILALGGVCFHWKTLAQHYWQLLAWILLAFLLAYSPAWFQAKMIFGVHIPICIVAGVAFDLFLSKVKKPLGRPWIAAAAVLIALAAATQVKMLSECMRVLKENPRGAYHIDDDLMEGLEFLRKNSRPSDIVFAFVETSTKLAAYSGNTVLWGHWAQSVDWQERHDWYRQIFDPRSGWDGPRRRRAFWGAGIRYIFLDGEERATIGRHPPGWLSAEADKVFENQAVVIYEGRRVRTSSSEGEGP